MKRSCKEGRIRCLHSISSNRDTLIGAPLVAVEKIGNNSLFGRKTKRQNILSKQNIRY